MICYVGIGWGIIFAVRPLTEAISSNGVYWLIGGGICYTIGAVLYGVGKKHKWMHSVFHLFVLAGSILHFFCMIFHVL